MLSTFPFAFGRPTELPPPAVGAPFEWGERDCSLWPLHWLLRGKISWIWISLPFHCCCILEKCSGDGGGGNKKSKQQKTPLLKYLFLNNSSGCVLFRQQPGQGSKTAWLDPRGVGFSARQKGSSLLALRAGTGLPSTSPRKELSQQNTSQPLLQITAQTITTGQPSVQQTISAPFYFIWNDFRAHLHEKNNRTWLLHTHSNP